MSFGSPAAGAVESAPDTCLDQDTKDTAVEVPSTQGDASQQVADANGKGDDGTDVAPKPTVYIPDLTRDEEPLSTAIAETQPGIPEVSGPTRNEKPSPVVNAETQPGIPQIPGPVARLEAYFMIYHLIS